MLKRAIDLTGAALGLIVLSPVLIAVTIAVRLSMGSPVLFRQERPGLGGRPFRMAKFRTMTDKRDASGRLLPDDARITATGRFLRRTSLDELPALINVLTGDLSLVGPRPLLMRYLPRYSPEQMRRHDVKPGITGWAQINGRNAISWEEKFALDLWYVERRSALLDLKILFLTVLRVLRRDGIDASARETMPEFMGTSSVAHAEAVHLGGAGGFPTDPPRP